ncbi:MAG: formylglycine-generating enzyme family protein [Campylobacterota bacterium]|nr:formylglycine-generating enzyme family protein [Campylobacterota bacterium]
MNFNYSLTCNDGYTRTASVGQYKVNPWDLYDMHGNVWEWCEDWYTDSYSKTPRDESANYSGEKKKKVLRGGSWGNTPNDLRSANRGRSFPSSRNFDFGFRLAGTLP